MLRSVEYCGRHLLLEIWTVKDSEKLKNIEEISTVMKSAANMAGATVLGDNWHNFGVGCGITGVVMLSESHMSIHTWPEHGYAAIDIFMCGNCNPRDTVESLVQYFEPIDYTDNHLVRGIIE